jgi:hypothetical protein
MPTLLQLLVVQFLDWQLHWLWEVVGRAVVARQMHVQILPQHGLDSLSQPEQASQVAAI